MSKGSRLGARGRRLLCVTKDAGGVSALVPVLERLGQHAAGLLVLAAEPSTSVLRERLGDRRPIEALSQAEPEARTRIGAAFSSWHPELLLVGTSHPGSPDQWAIELARVHGVPSLAVLDSWCQYEGRFSGSSPDERLRYLPDLIAVMDEYAHQGLVAHGVGESRIVVTGNPALDELAVLLAQPGSARSARVRMAERLGIDPETSWVLFLSENGEEIYRRLPELSPGYTEVDVFGMLYPVLQSERERSRQVTLIVRRHPGEHMMKYPPASESPEWLRYDQAPASGREAVLASDLIVGITSTLLVEAYLAGKRVISVQPNARSDEWLILTHLGRVKPVRTREELAWSLAAALRRGESRETIAEDRWAASLVDGGATARVVEAILGLLNRGEDEPRRHLPGAG